MKIQKVTLLLALLLALPLTAQVSLKVSLSGHKLALYRDGALVRTYDAGTVKKGLPHPVGPGRVTAVYFHPVWNPMPLTRKSYLDRGIVLPAVVPYGHPERLGTFKMVLSHHSTRYHFSGAYAIHGCKDEKSIGGRVSGGCVRLHNAEGFELAQQIQAELKAGRTVQVLIEE